jgi:hypothetical protein
MTSSISASAERELERQAKHRLAVPWHFEEANASGSVAATCCYYWITRTAYHSGANAMRRAVSRG